MPNSSHRPLTRSYSRVLESFGSVPPRSRSVRRTFSAGSELSEEGFVELDPKMTLLAAATEDDLLKAGNVAYTRLLDAYNHAKKQHNKINERYQKLKASDRASDRPPTLVSSSPAIPTPVQLPVPTTTHTNATINPSQQNFPDIRFWFKRDYTKFTASKKSNDGITGLNQATKPRGRVRLSENENVMNDFIELEDGTVVDGTTAESIRARFRDVFAEQKATVERIQEAMPESWGQASVTFKKFLIKEVYEQFPYMRWCDNDWKVHFLATRVYSNWLKAQRLKEARVKVKVEKKEDAQIVEPTTNATSMPEILMDFDLALSSVSKRKASLDGTASVQSPSKRARFEATGTPETQAAPSIYSAPPTLAEPTPVEMTNFSPNEGTNSVASGIPSIVSTDPSTPAAASATSAPVVATRPRPRPRTRVRASNSSPVSDTILDSNTGPPIPVPPVTRAPEPPATPPPAILNPLISVFGSAVGPSARLESLANSAPAPRKSTTVLSTDGQPGPSTTIPVAGIMKRATASTSAKNLCYLEFLRENEPMTCVAFDKYYKGLSKAEIKKWNTLSKTSKSAGADK